MDALKKYWAFLSYSHQDTKVCEWLHQQLETFRIPKRLVGRESREGKTPARLFPVFRDRDELPGSSELGKNLTEALAQSRYLIVICSPAAARSRWVNEEIRQFKMMGGEGRILALITDGEPNAADKPNSGLLECFPEALKYRVDASGNLTSQRVEPIAADIRHGRESKSIALLRLIAGIIGVPFDELRQRDRQRARRSLLFGAAIVSVLSVLLATAAVTAYREDRRSRLEELGRDALMQDLPVNAAVYLAEAYRMGNQSRDLRIMLEQSMRSVDMLSTVHADDPDGVVEASFSDDATRVLLTSKAGRVTVLRADNGARLLRIEANEGDERRAAFLPGSKEIALIYLDGRIRITDAIKGAVVREATLPWPLAPNAIRFGNNAGFFRARKNSNKDTFVYDLNSLVQTQNAIGTCRIEHASKTHIYCLIEKDGQDVLTWYPLAGGASAGQLRLDKGIRGFAIDEAQTRVALTQTDGILRVLTLKTGKIMSQARHPGGIEVIKFSADGQRIATAGWAGSVLVWATNTGLLQLQVQAHAGKILDFHFLEKIDRFVTLGEDGTLKTWNALNGKLLSVAQTSHGKAGMTAVSPNGRQVLTHAASKRWNLAAEGLDVALKIWNLDEAGPVAVFGNGAGATWSFFDEQRTRLLFASSGTPATLWSTARGKLLAATLPYDGSSEVKFNPSGSAFANADGVFDSNSGLRLFAFTGHAQRPCCLAWSADGKVVVSSSNQQVQLWDVEGKSLRASISVTSSYPSVALTEDGRHIAVSTVRGVAIYQTDTAALTGEFLDKAAASYYVIERVADGKRFRVTRPDEVVEIDAISAKEIVRHKNRAFTAASACRGRLDFVARSDNRMVISDLITGKEKATLLGPDTESDLDCDDKLDFFATSGRNGAAVVWSAATTKPLLRMSGLAPGRLEVGFLPAAGELVVASAREGLATRWTFEEERRNPAIISRRVACRVPLQLDGYTLTPRSVDARACDSW